MGTYTYLYNPVDFPINITGSSHGDCNCDFPLDSDTKTNIERIRYSRNRLLSLGTPPPGTVNSNDCGITEHLCTHLADLNILNQPCPFHQVPKQLIKPKRWKKRGKGSKRQKTSDLLNPCYSASASRTTRLWSNWFEYQ